MNKIEWLKFWRWGKLLKARKLVRKIGSLVVLQNKIKHKLARTANGRQRKILNSELRRVNQQLQNIISGLNFKG